jgi:hypothetical protein
MKTPTWFRAGLADQGPLVLQGDITEEEAADRLADLIFAKNEGLVRGIVVEFARRKVEGWTSSHQPATALVRDDGQTDLFPGLPRKVEVSPGRFAAPAVMTGHDWDTALACAEAKEKNASGHAEKIRVVYDKVRPLLTDESLTTADVWNQPVNVALLGCGS